MSQGEQGTNRNYRQRSSYRVKRLFQTLRARVDDALDPLGLSMPQYGAIVVLESEGSLSNAALARLNFVTPQTMMRIVGSLEASGLIERDGSGAGRSIRFKLSEEGQRRIKEGHSRVAKIEQEMVSVLAPEQLAVFHEALDRCAEALNA